MAVYEYKGLSTAQKAVTGLKKEAESPKALRLVLKERGPCSSPTSRVRDRWRSAPTKGGARGAAETLNKDVNISGSRRGSISTDDVAIMTRQLATLLGAGVTLVEG